MSRFILSLLFFMGLSQLAFGESAPPEDYAKIVDTKIGTQGSGLGCGFTFVGAAYPFGMMQFTPSFFSPQKGIVVNQLCGAGCPHEGNFPVLPISGELQNSPNDMNSFKRYKTINESQAGYFAAIMEDGVECNTTVSKRSGIAEFIFPTKTQNRGTVLIGSGVSSTFVTNAHVQITSPNSCVGFAEGGDFCGSSTKYRVYFAAKFNTSAIKSGTWIGNNMQDGRLTIAGEKTGAYFVFDTQKSDRVEYQIAISYVSIENAHENLEKDNAGRTFKQVKNDTQKEWNHYLSTISVESADIDRKIQFYTNFYHALIHPNIFSDLNGEYIGADFQIHKTRSGRDSYTGFSCWDTYRTQSQLIAMLFPGKGSDMMQSAVDFAQQSGGYGRWVLANIETGIMHGDPMPILIANTYAFGGRDFDVQQAFKHMLRGAMVAGSRSQNQLVRPGLENYMKKGIENASLCLEYASADYAIGQFADQAIGDRESADYFKERAQNWKNLYDPSTKWLRSRHTHDMSWKDPDHDWREACKENYFWMVPFDLTGLIDTLGGKSAAGTRLDTLFLRLDGSYDDHHFAAGNEPDFQVPWIYNWTDRPYKSSEVIHRVLSEMYTSKPTGLPGNDDLGAMGAWYVFASIGMYPMIPGVAGFSINAPQFESIAIRLPKGNLTICGGRSQVSYINTMSLNGKKTTSTWLDWSQIENGATIDYVVSGKANKKWGM